MYRDHTDKLWYKLGLHIHTNLSDGVLTPEQAAKRYLEAGYDAIAITDHWKYHHGGNIGGLPIISGCEYDMGGSDTAAGVMHIVGLGMKEEPKVTKDSTRQQVIDAIIEAGGMPVLAHPAWSLNTSEDVKKLTGFEALEIYNTVSGVHESDRAYSGYIVDVLANAGMVYPLLATDDAHYYDGTDDVKSYIMVCAESNSTEDLLAAVRKGEFYATQGPWLDVKREDGKIIVNCSECVKIAFFSNYGWASNRIKRGENLTWAEYQIKEKEKWIRVEVCDRRGNYAWSNILCLD